VAAYYNYLTNIATYPYYSAYPIGTAYIYPRKNPENYYRKLFRQSKQKMRRTRGYGGTSKRYPRTIRNTRRSTRRRTTVPRRNRGYLRTGGFYGRYRHRHYQPSQEVKFFDAELFGTGGQATVIPAAGTITPSINLVSQGVTERTAVGRKYTIKSIHVKFFMDLPSTIDPDDTTDSIRLVVYLDTQANGATALVADLLQDATVWNSFNELSNSLRFKILMNKTVTLTSRGSDASTFAKVQTNRMFNKKCNIPIEYTLTGGAIGTIQSNNIGIMAITEGGLIRLLVQTRIRFTDK